MKNSVTIMIFLLCVCVSCTQAFANTLPLASSSFNYPCRIGVHHQLSISPSEITFYQSIGASAEQIYSIRNDEIIIKGQKLVLSNSQKQAVASVDLLIRDGLVDVNLFLYDAFNTAKESIRNDFTPLLGASSQPIQLVNNELNTLERQFNQYFSPSNKVLIDEQGAFVSTIIGQNVDNYVNTLSQQLLADSSLALMSSTLASGESFGQIQQKIKSFSKQFKSTLNQHKKQLNTNTKQLCTKFDMIDKAETYMQSKIPELSKIDGFVAK